MKTIALDDKDIAIRKGLDFTSGDTVKVWNKIIENDGKVRLQAFEGMVLARKHGTETGATFTVRKVTSGVGVERVYPLFSSSIDKIEITRTNRTRRSKLYYVRDKALRDVRRKLKVIKKVIKRDGVSTSEVAEEVAEATTE